MHSNPVEQEATSPERTSTEAYSNNVSPPNQPAGAEPVFHADWRIWVIFSGLAVSALLSALEGSVISTALPTIAAELGSGGNYVWVINLYFLTSAIFQPLCGQFADLWGRRWLMISSVLVFLLGSAICGAAQNTAMLIVGRGIQGVGGGGINMLVDVIICDMIPLRERGKFIGLLFAIISMTASFGPLIGGALAGNGQWRWVFFLNLPIGAVALAILFIFLRLSHRGGLTWQQRVRQIDYIGNAFLIISTVLVLYVLTYAGSKYSWSNPQMVALLTVGLVALLVFAIYEYSPLCTHPVMPPVLFGNRTSSAAFFISFNHSLLTIWTTYFFPLYFQSVLGASPTRSGVNLLVLVFIFPLFAAIAGGMVAKFGEYRLVHLISMSLITIGFGCSSLLDETSRTGVWVILQLIIAAGLGACIPSQLPAIQAGLTENEAASSTATWAFIRSLGMIWGVAIPAAVFNNRAEELLYQIDDPAVRAQLAGGEAYEHATAAFVRPLDPVTEAQVKALFVAALRRSWLIGIVFAGVSVMAVGFEKRTELRKELETDFGLEGKKEKEKEAQEGGNMVSEG
ncbi:MAG: hypothetical protein LQ348_000448 [Seirophora lacunosa]|nr:MAG: hypothetical protein LQ348_000448 [Seirophora lacunosa]